MWESQRNRADRSWRLSPRCRRSLLRDLKVESLDSRRLLAQSHLPQLITPQDLADGAEFGHAVALSRNFAVVGAPSDIKQTGEPAEQIKSGAAYVYGRLVFEGKEQWLRLQKLQVEDAQPGDQFGYAVAIDRDSQQDTIAVGAPLTDQHGDNSGSVYVFTRDPLHNNWDQIEITPKDAGEERRFGSSVAVSSDRIVVGAPGLSSGGAAYVFQRSDVTGNWDQIDVLTDTEVTQFGISVSISGDSILVGSNSTSGSAFVFTEPDLNTSLEWKDSKQKLPQKTGDCFGHSVSIDAESPDSLPIAVVGACGSEAAPSEAAHLYERRGGKWEFSETLKLGDEVRQQQLGRSVSVDNDVVVLGSGKGSAAYTFARDADRGNQWVERANLVAESEQSNEALAQAVAVHGETVMTGSPAFQHIGAVQFDSVEVSPDIVSGADLSFEVFEAETQDNNKQHFVVKVSNSGSRTALNVRTLNTFTQNNSVDFVVGCADVPRAPVCSLGSIADGQSKSYVISATTNGGVDEASDLDLHVAVLSDTPELDPSDNLGSWQTQSQETDLAVTLIGPEDPVTAGSNGGASNLPLTVLLTNEGTGTARQIEVEIAYGAPDDVVLSPASDDRFDPMTGSWTVGELAPGESALLNLHFGIPETSALDGFTSTATITKPDRDTDPNADNDRYQLVTDVQAAPKEVNISGPTEIVEGAEATYTVALSGQYKAGESIHIELDLEDIDTSTDDYDGLPMALANASGENWNYAGTGTKVTWTAPADNQMPKHLEFTLSVTDDVTPEGDESYKIQIKEPITSSLGFSVSLGMKSSVTTIITDHVPPTWSITGPPRVDTGQTAYYAISLSGTLPNEARVALELSGEGSQTELSTALTQATENDPQWSLSEKTLTWNANQGNPTSSTLEIGLLAVETVTGETEAAINIELSEPSNDTKVSDDYHSIATTVRAGIPGGADAGITANFSSRSPLDTNRDGHGTPVATLFVIRALNGKDTGVEDAQLDVSGDGHVSPVDALIVIRHINNQTTAANNDALAAQPATLGAEAVAAALMEMQGDEDQDDDDWL